MDTNSFLQGQLPNSPQIINPTTQSATNCHICNKPPDNNTINCKKCRLSFHLLCANIGTNQPQSTWLCQNCSESQQTATHSPRSIRSCSTNSSRASRSRRQLLELQRLQEETQLEREFIRKKYQILEQAVEEDDAQSITNSIHQWLNNQPDTVHPRTSVEKQTNLITTEGEDRTILNETTYFAFPQQTVTTNLPSSSHLSPTYGKNVSTNPVYTTATQPNFTTITSSNNNVNSNMTTFINKAPNNNSNLTIENVSSNANTGVHSSTLHPVPPPQFVLNEPSFTSRPSINATQNNLTHQQINARQTVPKDLPTFSGMPEEWPLFSSTFEWSTAVCGLSDAENLVRLQKALRGEALRSVQHILLHPSCVPAAISTLQLLYGQPEKILNSIKNKIKSLSAISTNKLDTITSFAVEVKGLETTIKACGLLDELNNSSLLQELIIKMPSYFQLNWGSYKTNLIKNNKKVNLTEFANWIYDVGISASSVNIEINSSTSTSAENFTRKTRNADVYTHDVQQSKIECVVCFDTCSSVEKCKKFLTADRNERWNLVRKHNLCKLCLRRHYGICNSSIVCGKEGCQIKHNSLLHRSAVDEKEANVTKEIENANTNINLHAAHSGAKNNTILFKILPINIYGKNNKCLKTYAFIDGGSAVSLINETVIKELNLTGEADPLCLKWTADMWRNEDHAQLISVQLSGPNKTKYFMQGHMVKVLDLPSQSLHYKILSEQFPYLKGLPIEDYEDAVPTVLVGLNNLKLCTPTRVKEGNYNEPTALCTRLGWFVCGSLSAKQPKQIQHSFHICECDLTNDKKLNCLLKKFYSLEMAGISSTPAILGKDEQRATSLLENNTKQKSDGHYETALLWRYENIKLPQSYDMAKKRLLCLEKTLKKNKDLFIIFEKTIAEYLEKQYIQKIEKSDDNQNGNQKVWYLPIFPVFNKNKPNKTRIVWDAAAKANGVSLNSMLLKGPDLLSSLPSILFRFRQKNVAVCGDIEQMFHQIHIREEDCNAQRFLWRSCDENKVPDVYVMKVMIFGASCAPCISQYVKNLNASKFENTYPLAAAAIKYNHYVDDFLISTDTPEEATKLAKDVRYIHSQAGFNIRNWCSNSTTVLNALNSNELSNTICLNIGDGFETEKILGIFWNPADDIITFKLSPSILNSELFLGNKEPTKREVLKVLMSIYDPLGLIGNFLMYLKIIMQEIWRSGVQWDEPILNDQRTKWRNWLSFLPHLKNINIPRCYLQKFPNYNHMDVQLHTFVDASENGYAAVSYFRIFDGTKVVVSLIGSKTRVAPLKVVSIPRLELMAALIGARFANFIAENHNINVKRRIFWSDSRTILSWIRSDHRKYHQFVAVRVSEILDISEMDERFWISGKMNVADEATKWAKKPDLSDSSRWFRGPDFLKLPECRWQNDIEDFTPTEIDLKQHNLVIQNIEPFINIERFSRWCRILRATAFVIRFCQRLKNKTATQNATELTQEELYASEVLLLKEAQKQSFYDEIKCLKENKKLTKSSFIYKLSPYIDKDGVLRVGGRIENANVPEALKHPAILPKYGHTTNLIILHYHNLYHHINHETVVNEIRQRYYIPKLRVICKSVVKQCQMCKIKNAAPEFPQMAKLPRARLAAFLAPFTYTGLDFFGPMFVTVNRHKEKRYGALFTCLTIRAVHIEIVNSLNTSSCIMAIRNFIARRGQPREFFSDNGTNFVGADRELREALKEVDKNKFVRSFTTANTKWNFNPPSAPHMGGAWERLVRSVKTIFYKIKQERFPNDETLRSMMAEVENIINSRPLTYVPVESENEEAVTPNHFLLGNSNGIKPLASYEDDGVVLRESWLCSQQYAQKFWKRWVAEYLPTLTCRTKWFEKAKTLAVGDLVVVVDPANPRNVWPKGRIIEVYMSEDGQVRKAKVMTTCGILERPAAKLAVLDVANKEE